MPSAHCTCIPLSILLFISLYSEDLYIKGIFLVFTAECSRAAGQCFLISDVTACDVITPVRSLIDAGPDADLKKKKKIKMKQR